jgi:hypothetical protein
MIALLPNHDPDAGEAALEAYRGLLRRNRRLKAQVRLFDALSRVPGRTRPVLALVDEDGVSQSESPHREDNRRRAVHERAKALQRNLQVYSGDFGGAIGWVCRLTWDAADGDSREYRLEVAPADHRVDERQTRRIRDVRSAAKRVLQVLNARDGLDEAHVFELRRLSERLAVEAAEILRHVRFSAASSRSHVS